MVSLRWFAVVLISVSMAAVPASSQSSAQQELPNTPAGRILASWLTAHNQGDREAIATWVRSSFAREPRDTAVVDKRVDWYVEAVKEFGELIEEPHRIIENEPHRLVVQLLSVELRGHDPSRLNPLKVIQIEVDVDPERPEVLQRGLGIGPLACELRR